MNICDQGPATRKQQAAVRAAIHIASRVKLGCSVFRVHTCSIATASYTDNFFLTFRAAVHVNRGARIPRELLANKVDVLTQDVYLLSMGPRHLP